jgi:hypothetical protein
LFVVVYCLSLPRRAPEAYQRPAAPATGASQSGAVGEAEVGLGRRGGTRRCALWGHAGSMRVSCWLFASCGCLTCTASCFQVKRPRRAPAAYRPTSGLPRPQLARVKAAQQVRRRWAWGGAAERGDVHCGGMRGACECHVGFSRPVAVSPAPPLAFRSSARGARQQPTARLPAACRARNCRRAAGEAELGLGKRGEAMCILGACGFHVGFAGPPAQPLRMSHLPAPPRPACRSSARRLGKHGPGGAGGA